MLHILMNFDRMNLLLTKFAQGYFKAREAVQIDAYQDSVDNGLNDLRAVIKPALHLITSCCRYKKDVQHTDTIVRQFAVKNGLDVMLFDSGRKERYFGSD